MSADNDTRVFAVSPEAASRIEARYRKLSPRSGEAFERHARLMPAGVPGGITQSFPYQLYISRGDGCHVWDADGRKLVDLVYGDWLYPLGHNHPAVTAAIAGQLVKGPTFCIPDPDLGYEAASRLLARFPWLDMIRYTASGTEATLMATRLARAYTHRPKIAKIAGGYHGVHDASMIVNMRTRDPFVTPQGLIPGTEDSVVLLPYNDTETSLKTIETHADQLAGIIIEPMMGGSGMIPASREYLEALRDITRRLGIVFIMDEVVTFPYGPAGIQGAFGIESDITTFGKAIGGGTPLGAFAGTELIMSLMDNRLHEGNPPVRHASTVGGAPLCLAASVAVLDTLTDDIYRHLHALGDRLRSGVGEIAAKHDVPLQATGAGHFFALHWTPVPVVDFLTAMTSDRVLMNHVLIALYNEGYILMSPHAGTLSAPMTDEHVDGLLQAIEDSLAACGLIKA
jgi:glutamate-1-semialdehyde 2,1-aminomutase